MVDPRKKEDRWAVRPPTSNWAEGMTSPRDGWMLPAKVKAEAERGGVRVEIEIDVVEGRARARRVTVETDNPHGVGWAALAKAPIRDIVATAILASLWKTVPRTDGTPNIVPMELADEAAAHDVVQAAVGYRPTPIEEA